MSKLQNTIETDNSLHAFRTAKPLTVLFFSHSAQLAGSERGLLELVARLIGDYKADCTVICPGEGPLVIKLQSVGATTLLESRLTWWAGIGAANAIQDNLAAGARALLKIFPTLQEIDPDVVYTQTITIPWGACAAALLDKPHYWSICEFGELDHGLRFLNGFADVLEQVKAGASFIRTPSDAVRTSLFADLGPDRVRTVYRPGPMPTAIRPSNEYFHRAGATRLAVFGTICEGKGQIDAVRATADLAARGRDVELLIAGYSSPEYRAKVEALIDARGIRDRVRISDFLPEPYSTMLAADIILVCSRNEAFGRVVVEAMQLGRPVVYARSGGIPEYMKDGVVGLSYSPGDANELMQRIEELLDDPVRAARIGGEAKRYASRKFTRNDSDFRILEDLKQRRGSTDWRVAMPRDVVASLSAVVLGAEQDLMNAQNQLNSIHQKYEETGAALREQQRSMQSKEGELQLTQRLLAGRETELNKTQRLLAGRETELNKTQRLLARKETELNKAKRLLDRRERQLTEIFRSRSWRLTTPLRKLSSLSYGFKSRGSRAVSFSREIPMPPSDYMRLVCGEVDDESAEFQKVGQKIVERLRTLDMLQPNTRFLDVGCGCGRVARRLIDTPIHSYIGFDRHAGMIEWCNRHIAFKAKSFSFLYFKLKSVYTGRDGHEGTIDPCSFKFPFADGQFNSILAASVFTHMPLSECICYLKEINRVLDGKFLFSVFLAEDESWDNGSEFFHSESEFIDALESLPWRLTYLGNGLQYWISADTEAQNDPGYLRSQIAAARSRNQLEALLKQAGTANHAEGQ